MIPNRPVIFRREIGAGAEMFDSGVDLADGLQAKTELGVDEKILGSETDRALQGRDRLRDPVHIDISEAHRGHDAGAIRRDFRPSGQRSQRPCCISYGSFRAR